MKLEEIKQGNLYLYKDEIGTLTVFIPQSGIKTRRYHNRDDSYREVDCRVIASHDTSYKENESYPLEEEDVCNVHPLRVCDLSLYIGLSYITQEFERILRMGALDGI